MPSTNTIEPPRNWPADKRKAAELVYGTAQCNQCLRFVYNGQWMFETADGHFICETCWNKGVR